MKNEKSTIIILTPGFAANELDTTCLPAQQSFIKALKENFPNLDIIILAFHYPFYRGLYTWNGIDVISLDGRNKRKLFKLFFWNRAISELKKVYQKNKVIGILSFWCGECAWIGKRFSRKYGLKHYCWIRGQDAKPGNKFVNRIRPTENELIAISDFLRSEFEKNYSIRPAHVIPSGIDPKEFLVPAGKRDIDILGAGSLIGLKQYDIFIHLISEIKKTFPGVKAVICGKGPEEKKLKEQIAKSSLEENISLTGELPHSEILRYMQRSKIFLHTSSYEGFSGVCLEALAAGTQVISFTRAMDHEIEHWNILKTKEEMVNKIIEILQHEPDHSPVIPFTADTAAKKIMKLFGL